MYFQENGKALNGTTFRLAGVTTLTSSDYIVKPDSVADADGDENPKEKFREIQIDGHHHSKIAAILFQKLADFAVVLTTVLHFMWIISVVKCATHDAEGNCPAWVLNPLNQDNHLENSLQ